MLTWDEARNDIIETTEIGYTLKSLDKIWVAATIEDGSSGWAKENPEWIGNPIYATVDKAGSYEIWDTVACFTSRRECEAFIESFGDPYRWWWFPLNMGDETRWEHKYLDGKLHDLSGRRYTPKFKGSYGWFDWRIRIYKSALPDRCCYCAECEPADD